MMIPDYDVLHAMVTYGGSFARHLAEAARHADAENLSRIKQTWPEYWAQYTEIARDMRARATK